MSGYVRLPHGRTYGTCYMYERHVRSLFHDATVFMTFVYGEGSSA